MNGEAKNTLLGANQGMVCNQWNLQITTNTKSWGMSIEYNLETDGENMNGVLWVWVLIIDIVHFK